MDISIPRGLAVAVTLIAAMARPALAESLNDAANDTWRRHPLIQSDRSALAAGDEAVTTARTGYFPSVSVNGLINRDDINRLGSDGVFLGRSGTVEVDQMLFDGFVTANRDAAAQADRQALLAAFDQDANTTLMAVVRAYLGVLRDRELLAAARQNLADHQAAVKRVAEIASYDDGKAFDLEQIKMREAYASSFIPEREGALRTSESQFLELLGHKPRELTVPARPRGKEFGSLDAAIAQTEQHPNVVGARAREASRHAEREQAKGVVSYPRLDLTARYVKGWDVQALPGQNDETYAGLQASYAISTGGGQIATLRGAEQQEQAAHERVAAAQLDARENTRVAWMQRASIEATMPAANDHLVRARIVSVGYNEQYKLGRRSVLELLIVQDEVYQAQARVIQLTYDQLTADFDLAAQMGTLYRYLPEPPPPASPRGPAAKPQAVRSK